MPRTPDRFSGPSDEEEVQFEDRGPGGDASGDPTTVGALRRVSDNLRYLRSGGVSQLLQATNYPVGFEGVDLDSLADGELLAYNAATSRFVAIPAGTGTGITAEDHRDLDQLVHEIAETSFEEVIRSGFLVTDVIIWTTPAKIQKIREQNIVYSGFRATQITNTQYDATGTPVEILVENISYTGFFVDAIDRVRTL